MRARGCVGVASLLFMVHTSASAQTPIGEEFRVNTYVDATQALPQAASSAAGESVVIWDSFHFGSQGQDGDYDGVFGQRFDAAGEPSGSEFQVNTVGAGQQVEARVAMAPDGQFVVVWWTHLVGVGSQGVFGQRFDAAGNPIGGEFQAGASPGRFVLRPSVAMHGDGSFVVVWEEWYNPAGQLFGQRFDAGGSPQGEFVVVPHLSFQWEPQVAALTDGRFVIAWTEEGAGGGTIKGQQFSSSGSAVGGVLVLSDSTGYANAPRITVAQDGTWLLVWNSDWLTPGALLRARRFSAASVPQGSSYAVHDSVADRRVASPSVAIAPNGDSIVAWEAYDIIDDSYEIYARQFRAGERCRAGVPGQHPDVGKTVHTRSRLAVERRLPRGLDRHRASAPPRYTGTTVCFG
jgi:large repetitive protein